MSPAATCGCPLEDSGISSRESKCSAAITGLPPARVRHVLVQMDAITASGNQPQVRCMMCGSTDQPVNNTCGGL
jgi:hypothetical protein